MQYRLETDGTINKIKLEITVLKTNEQKPVTNGQPLFSLRNKGPESSGH